MNRKQRRATSRLGGPGQMTPAAETLLAAALRHAQAGRLAEAIAGLRRVTALAPGAAVAHYNLAQALAEAGRAGEAATSFRKAIEIIPGFAQAHGGLGAALQEDGLVGEAEYHCRQAVALAPREPVLQFNLGTVLDAQRKLDEAAGCYRAAIALQPDFAQAHANLAMLLLAQGKMVEGWRAYEWRWRTGVMLAERRDFRQPRWTGEPGNGRTLLIYAEQGFGDTIQFCRYAALAAARGWRVVLQVPRPLLRLMRTLPGGMLAIAQDEPLPPFDLQVPMLTLPGLCNTDLATIPAPSPYLYADAEAVAAYAARLAAAGCAGVRVGLVWAGSSRQAHTREAQAVDRRRSIAFARLAPLLRVPGVSFVSLQREGAAPLTDLMDKVTDFADTAALIMTLDLVIAVDTAVAHLAAALGRPVWLLNRFDSCWRWLAGRRDSPWYPTLTVYQQPRPDDWEAVIADMAADLRVFAAR